MATQFSIKDGRHWKAPFFTIWGGQALSLLGSQLVQFALIWYLTVETSSATVLATASMVGLVPRVLLGPLVGTLVDRWNRRRTMMAADGVIMLVTILLAVLFALDMVEIWQVYVMMFIRSLAGGFHGNAMGASTALMVPTEHLTRIQGINQMLNGGLDVVAAPLGAILFGLLPMQGILAIDVVTALAAIVPLVFIRVPQPERIERRTAQNGESTSVWQDFIEGLRYVKAWPGLMIIALMAICINFLITPAFSLMPLLVKDYFGGGALELGWVNSTAGIGIIIGGTLLSVWGGFKRKILTTFLGLTGMGIGILAIAFAPASSILWLVIPILIIGVMMPLTNGPIGAVMQSSVDPDMQARVSSLLSSVAGGMSPIGLMIAGPVSDRVGIQSWYILGGIICLVFAAAGPLIPAVMNLEVKNQDEIEVEENTIPEVYATD